MSLEEKIPCHSKFFSIEEIKACLDKIKEGKTFEELDEVFFENMTPDKGLLGHFMEMSVLGMPMNSLQEADLEITYENGKTCSTELKTTGVHDRGLADGETYHAKECASLTAVSIGSIENESWEESHFYKKLAHLLWVFYFYKRNKGQMRVPYEEYKKFPVLGYAFFHLAERPDDLAKFKSDWEKARQFIIEANKKDNPEEWYPLLHSSIKKNLFFVDIAPRYQKKDPLTKKESQTPRFRLKKPYVNTLFQEFWRKKNNKKSLEILKRSYLSMDDFDADLRSLSGQYRNQTVGALAKHFNLCVDDAGLDNLKKDVSEKIASRMFGCESKAFGKIKFFSEMGIIAKTVVLSNRNLRTEDMKLFTMNLEQMENPGLPYEETEFVEYFSDKQLLCVIFKEPFAKAPLKDNVFVGFKRLVFPDSIVDGPVKKMYEESCRLIREKCVEERLCRDKNENVIINKNGEKRVSLNFPKAKDYDVFVRGTGTDSSKKYWRFEGKSIDGSGIIKSYALQFWLKGTYVAKALSELDAYI